MSRPTNYFDFIEYEAEEDRRNGDIPRHRPYVIHTSYWKKVDGKLRKCDHDDMPSQNRESGECDQGEN